MKAHVAAVLRATPLSCMLYNNPLAYKTDFLPGHVAELAAEFPTLHAIKESSADVRRIMAIRSLVGQRLQLLCGVDDLIVEAVAAGAVGWIAGLVNAFPEESVALFQAARRGLDAEIFRLYAWFLPLLRLDVVPKFVQMIKLAQAMVKRGSAEFGRRNWNRGRRAAPDTSGHPDGPRTSNPLICFQPHDVRFPLR